MVARLCCWDGVERVTMVGCGAEGEDICVTTNGVVGKESMSLGVMREWRDRYR